MLRLLRIEYPGAWYHVINLGAAFACALTLAVSTSALAVDYTITDLGTLGGTSSYANGLNKSGQVVGRSADSTGTQYAFLYSNNTMTNLGTLSTSYNSSSYNPQSEAYGINTSGQVVGGTLNGSGHAFLYSNGTMTDIGVGGPAYGGGGVTSTAFAINNNGQAVGRIYSSPLSNNCFCNPQTLATFLPPSWTSNDSLTNGLGTLPNGNSSEAHGFNDNGQVVGWSTGGTAPNGGTHAFLWQNNVMTDLGTLAGSQGFTSRGFGINNNGWVVGDSQINQFNSSSIPFDHAFLYRNGVMIDLGTLNPASSTQISIARGINNNGQVVGLSNDVSGSTDHGFLWQNGVMTDLNNLLSPNSGWIVNDATGINDLGQITGNGTINGQIHAFLMIPANTATPTATDTPTSVPTNTPTATPTATNTATPTPTPVGVPKLSGTIAAKGPQSPGVMFVDLQLTNVGTGGAFAIQLKTFSFRTLAGSGTVTYNASLSPTLPIAVGNLAVGAGSTIRLYLNVPGTVTRFSITENGTLQDGVGTAYAFSIGQAIIP